MRLKISEGNSKLGKIPNLSLPPITTCRVDVPCAEACYARKSYRMYLNVRNAWDSNWALYQEDPELFFGDLINYLARKKPERFRLHVSGDCPDQRYFNRMADIFHHFQGTKCLMFTKRYDLQMSGTTIKVVLSTWPGMDLPENNNLPWAWLEEDPRLPKDEPYIHCPGGCDACGMRCWDGVSAELPVVFSRH